MGRAPCCDKANVKKGPWSPEEDSKLKSYIEQNGTGGNWIALPQKIGIKRCGKSCRLRWLNYLRPDIKHGGFSDEEDNIICSLYLNIGSRWSIIAAQLPGRTDNDIKNYWNTKLKKKLLGKRLKELHNCAQRKSGLVEENPLMTMTKETPYYWPQMPVLASIPYSNQDDARDINDQAATERSLIELGAGSFSSNVESIQQSECVNQLVMSSSLDVVYPQQGSIGYSESTSIIMDAHSNLLPHHFEHHYSRFIMGGSGIMDFSPGLDHQLNDMEQLGFHNSSHGTVERPLEFLYGNEIYIGRNSDQGMTTYGDIGWEEALLAGTTRQH